jgi:hypothetical protein
VRRRAVSGASSRSRWSLDEEERRMIPTFVTRSRGKGLFHSFENDMSDTIKVRARKAYRASQQTIRPAAPATLLSTTTNNNNNNQRGAPRTREKKKKKKPEHDSIIIDHPRFLLPSGLRCHLCHSQRPLAFLLVLLRRLDCSLYLYNSQRPY